MRGSLRQRYKGSWSLILDLGYETDPTTGRRKRKQKWVTFRGTRKEAESRLTDLVRDAGRGEFVEPTKLTLGEWLTEWLKGVKTQSRPATYTRYHGIVENHLAKAPIAAMPLQALRPSHLEAYYAASPVTASTLTLHHTVLQRALRKALRDHLVTRNVAADLEGRPRRDRGRADDARQHAWTAEQARRFLTTAAAAGPQAATLYALAIDTGARKGELCGLRWQDVDLEAGRIRIVQTLTKPGPTPTFGPPKSGKPRTVTLAAETVERLRAHRQSQAAVKMAHRTTYHDFGLVFAKESGDVRTRKDLVGQPLQANNLGERQFHRLVAAAGVPRIKFHGLRHTCATLLLQAGEPVHVVAQRLGHSDVHITLNTYAHVLPDQQAGAAAKLGALLHG